VAVKSRSDSCRVLSQSRPLLLIALLGVIACAGGQSVTTLAGDATTVAGGETGDASGGECTVESVYDKVEGLDREQRAAELTRIAAEEEGATFTKYTNMSASDNEPLLELFEEEYGIEGSVFVSSSNPLTQRLLTEVEAGVGVPDVLVASASSIEQLRILNEGMFARMDSPYREDLVPAAAQSEYWIGPAVDVFVGTWNVDLVAPEEAPTTWTELADPKWEGRLGMESGDVPWFATLVGYYMEEEGMTEDEAVNIFREISANSRVFQGHSLLAELNATGEFDVGLSQYLHIIDERVEEGTLAWEPAIQPIVVKPDGIAILCQAEKPASALLYAEMLVSEAGQGVLAEQGRETTSTVVQSGLLAQSEGYEVILEDYDRVVGEFEKWIDLYEELIGLGVAG